MVRGVKVFFVGCLEKGILIMEKYQFYLEFDTSICTKYCILRLFMRFKAKKSIPEAALLKICIARNCSKRSRPTDVRWGSVTVHG